MNAVTEVHFKQTWHRLASLTPAQAQPQFERLSQQQPALMGYLMAMENLEREDRAAEPAAGGELLFTGIVVLEAMLSAAGHPLRAATVAEVEAAEERNVQSLQNMDEGAEVGWLDGVQGLMQTYNQTVLLGCLVSALMEDAKDEPDLADESAGLHLLTLKTVVDCLDAL